MSTVSSAQSKSKPALGSAMPAGECAHPTGPSPRDEWVIRLPRIRLSDRLQPPGRFSIEAADPDWMLLAVVLEGSGGIASPDGAESLETGEALIVPPGQSVAIRTPRWMRLLVVGGLVSAIPAMPARAHVLRNARPLLEQIARIGRNTRPIASILNRTIASAFDAAVDESVHALIDEILRTASSETVPDTV